MENIKPGTRYTKNGIGVDVHEVKDGEVYYRKWPPMVNSMPFLDNLHRMPIDQFLAQIEGAEIISVTSDKDVDTTV